MTESQEDALYEFLENVTEPFALEDVTAFVRMVDPKKTGRLAMEIASLIDSRNIAFRIGTNRWVSKRGCFEPVRFVISPTRLELLNGILIPGHRCIPFISNPMRMPQEYQFYWKGAPIPLTAVEADPEELYPYYMLFGEEYAPQYVARDNPENEAAYNEDPYEDPAEVSIGTLDMRNIYRETAFVPGDRFVVSTLDWKGSVFELKKVGKDEWAEADLQEWLAAAEKGFKESFENLGPGVSTEEQIAYAYWYGGKRMREVPAYSLETFLYDKTSSIETVSFGIETRFWFAGKEIPDRKNLEGALDFPNRTLLEDILFRKGIPVSEYVIQSYVWDALYRSERDISHIIERIVPPSVGLEDRHLGFLIAYVADVFERFSREYNCFTDRTTGSIRQRLGELHTAVIDLVARLHKGGIDQSWLPKHTYVILSQIQSHAAGIMEELDSEEPPPEAELEAIDNSLDSMIETYEDIKELIDDAIDNFRLNNISVVRNTRNAPQDGAWWMVQIGLKGTDVWRRLILPESCRLAELHDLIQTLFGWNEAKDYRFVVDPAAGRVAQDKRAKHTSNGRTERTQYPEHTEPETALDTNVELGTLHTQGIIEMLYEYGAKWTVTVLFLSAHENGDGERIRCVSGAGAAPPAFIDGSLRFKRLLAALETGSDMERRNALHELGRDFDPAYFDMETCNRQLASLAFNQPIQVNKQKRDTVVEFPGEGNGKRS